MSDNATKTHERNILDGLNEWVEKTPAAPAVVCGEQVLSYRDLDRRANQLAWWIRDHAVGPESVVAMAVRRNVDMAVAVVGILKADAGYLPLEPDYPEHRVLSILADPGCGIVVADPEAADRLRAAGSSLEILSLTDENIADFPVRPPKTTAGVDNLQYVLYTSGSTGRPKGIAMSHGPQIRLLDWCRNRYAGQSVSLQYFPITTDVASVELFCTWWSGGCVVIANEWERYDIAAVARLIRRHKISRILLPVVAMQQLARHATEHPEDVETLRELITTGDRQVVTAELRQMCDALPDVFLDNHYGSTEINVVTAPRLTPPAADWPDSPLLGRPIGDARTYVLDANLMPVPKNVQGEIYVGGGPLARGYAGSAALTAASFVPDPFAAAPGARMYRTGDVGRWRAGGVLEFLGRADFQIKYRGYRIEPSEIEAMLIERDDVSQAVVALIRSDDREMREGMLTAYVVPAPLPPGAVLHAEPLRDHLTTRLPPQMVPQAFVITDALPMTETGKIDRHRLPHPDEIEPESVAPRDDLETVIAKVWADALGVDSVGVKHNFFSLGGHSLLVTRVIYELREILGVDLPLAALFERPTIESLAIETRRLMDAER